MSERLLLINPEQAKLAIAEMWRSLAPPLREGRRFWLRVTKERRTLPQNARMWAMLTEVSEQVDWYGHRLTPEEWKDVFTASLRGQRAVPNLDNSGFVVLGSRTSEMSTDEISDLMELMSAFAAGRGITFATDYFPPKEKQ